MTRLSVIIPGYNTPERWWRRCLYSVRQACGPNDEIICVDDGSSKHPDVLDTIAEVDPRVKPIFLTQNIGQSAARNLAIEKAKGEWISFVDSDDEVMPNIYGECLRSDVCNGADIVLFGVRVIWPNERLYKEDVPTNKSSGQLGIDDISSLFNGCLFEYSWNRIYRKAFLDKNKIRFDVGICPGEDTIFALKCVMADARVAQIPVVGYIYYRTFGTSLARYQKRYDESLRIRNDLWDKVLEHCYDGDGDVPKLGKLTDSELAYWSMQNAWRYDSPLSLKARWQWIKDNRCLLPHAPIVALLKHIAAYYARRYFYFRPIRRWKIMRMFPNAKEMI